MSEYEYIESYQTIKQKCVHHTYANIQLLSTFDTLKPVHTNDTTINYASMISN